MKVWKVPSEDGMISGMAINSKRLDRQPFMRYNIQNRGCINIKFKERGYRGSI
jgi:hypothetical protein